MKTSGTTPGDSPRKQKYCQYVKQETGKPCGEPLLGKGRLSQGRSRYCDKCSPLADKESRKQNGTRWVQNSRAKRPDLERFTQNVGGTKNKILRFLASLTRDESYADFLEYCDNNQKDIGRWFRDELRFANTVFSMGYPDTISLAVTEQTTSLYVIELKSQLLPWGYLLSSQKPCSPKIHYPTDAMTYSQSPGIGISKDRFARTVEVLFRSENVRHSLRIMQYKLDYWISRDSIYNFFTMSCRTEYPLCSIASLRDVSDEKRLIMVVTSMPYFGVSFGSGEIGDNIPLPCHLESYENPPSLDYYNGFCPFSLPDFSYLRSGFRYFMPSIIIYRGEELVTGRKGRGKKKVFQSK